MCEARYMGGMTGLSHNLKSLRKSAGLTQQDLATHSGVSRRTIQEIEGGSTSPTVETLDALAGAIGCETNDLIGGKSRPAPQIEHSTAFPLSDRIVFEGPRFEDAAPILEAIQRADPALRALVLALLFERPDLLEGFPDIDIGTIVGSVANDRR